jgi:flagellar assembly factor FliW
MVLNTRHFGEIEVEVEKIVLFENGLPGFPRCKRFVLLEQDSDPGQANRGLFWWLQSVDAPDTAFVLMDVMMLMPEYNPLIESEEISGLGEYDPETFVVYNIANIPDDPRNMTVNLKAPIVMNTAARLGKQVITMNDDYSIRHFIFEELNRNGPEGLSVSTIGG